MESLASGVFHELRERIERRSDRYCVEQGELTLSTFSNGNIEVQVGNVRDHVAVVLHTQTPPVADGIIQLFAVLDAIGNAHPRQTFVVFPYMPYSRSDRKNRARISVLGQRIPEILNHVLFVRRVLLLEPHDPHIKQYFVPTADEVPGVPLLVDYIRREYLSRWKAEDCVIVFADSGAAKRFEEVPPALGLEPAYMYKVRVDNSESPEVKAVTGNVKGRHCFLMDDEVLTGNTVIRDAKVLKEQGAASVHMLAVHGVFACKGLSDQDYIRKLLDSEVDEFVVTDSVPLGNKADLAGGRLKVIPIAPLLGEACMRLLVGDSLSELHGLAERFEPTLDLRSM